MIKCNNCNVYPEIDRHGEETSHKCADGHYKWSNGTPAFKSQAHLAPVWTPDQSQKEARA